jgi:hypothetical protein
MLHGHPAGQPLIDRGHSRNRQSHLPAVQNRLEKLGPDLFGIGDGDDDFIDRQSVDKPDQLAAFAQHRYAGQLMPPAGRVIVHKANHIMTRAPERIGVQVHRLLCIAWTKIWPLMPAPTTSDRR